MTYTPLCSEDEGADDLDLEIKRMEGEVKALVDGGCPNPRWERGLGWLRQLQRLRSEQRPAAIQDAVAPLAPLDVEPLNAEIKMMEDEGCLAPRWQRGLDWLRELRQRRAGFTPAQSTALRRFFGMGTGDFQVRVINGDEDDCLVETIAAFDAFFAVCRSKLGHDHVPIGIWETYKMVKERRAFVVEARRTAIDNTENHKETDAS